MRKLILFALACFPFMGVSAQGTGALYIKNNTSCDVKITMYAVAPCVGNTCGDMISNAFTVSSGSYASFSAWTSFSPGWAVLSTPVPGSCGNFQWSSVDFTWSGCPVAWGCTPAGGSMGDMLIGCTSSTASWSGGCSTSITGSWSPAQGAPLDDVGIDFH